MEYFIKNNYCKEVILEPWHYYFFSQFVAAEKPKHIITFIFITLFFIISFSFIWLFIYTVIFNELRADFHWAMELSLFFLKFITAYWFSNLIYYNHIKKFDLIFGIWKVDGADEKFWSSKTVAEMRQEVRDFYKSLDNNFWLRLALKKYPSIDSLFIKDKMEEFNVSSMNITEVLLCYCAFREELKTKGTDEKDDDRVYIKFHLYISKFFKVSHTLPEMAYFSSVTQNKDYNFPSFISAWF